MIDYGSVRHMRATKCRTIEEGEFVTSYKVRVTWQVETEIIVEAANVIDAQDRARKKAVKVKPQATTMTDVRVIEVMRPAS